MTHGRETPWKQTLGSAWPQDDLGVVFVWTAIYIESQLEDLRREGS